MGNAAEKVVRVEPDVYSFIVDFANEHDMKISEATSVLLRYCMDKNFEVVKREFTLIEKRPVLEEVPREVLDGRSEVD